MALTPKTLAEELSIDPKRLRGWLRKEYPRDVKGTSWDISDEAADAARENFAPAEDAVEA